MTVPRVPPAIPASPLAQLRHRPTAPEALGEPFAAFPSWFLRIECDWCGKVQWINQVHMPRSDQLLRDILARMRHEHCGGRAAKAELASDT